MAKVIIRSDEHYEHLGYGTIKRIRGKVLNIWSRSKKSDLDAKTERDQKARLEIKCDAFATGEDLTAFIFQNYTHVVM